MRFKLDENFGTRTQHLFRTSGHDVQTVREEGLQGCHDEVLFKRCQTEERCLVTFDLDFSNTLRYPPLYSKGIVIIRIPKHSTLKMIEESINRFLIVIASKPIKNELWIIDSGRIRVHDWKEQEEE